LTLKFKETIH